VVWQRPAVAAMDDFPWVVQGGLLDDVLPESVLVQSLPLNNKVDRPTRYMSCMDYH
jgi:hypothetical protein